MPKSMKIKVGNKAKSRRSSKNKASGKYSKQELRTIQNRRRKRINHLNRHRNDIQGWEKLGKSLGLHTQ